MTKVDLGGYQWPPTYSNWLKIVCWQFTIFHSFSGPKLPRPFLLIFREDIKFIFNLLDNSSIGRITERNTITRYTTFILGNPHGG
jgi:hypothetical protein